MLAVVEARRQLSEIVSVVASRHEFWSSFLNHYHDSEAGRTALLEFLTKLDAGLAAAATSLNRPGGCD